MKSNSILIVGCGDIGIRTGRLLLAAGWQVAGVRRNPQALPAEFTAYAADYTEPGSLDFISELKPDYVLATFNPSERSLEGYETGFVGGTDNLLRGLAGHRPKHILSVSSTRVLAESAGGWVDENSALAGDKDPRAMSIIEAEQRLLASPQAASVVRFAGIYGYPGGRLLTRIGRGELCAAQPPRYSNRIHRDDCAGFLGHLLLAAVADQPLEPVYIGVDDQPALQFEVESWLATRLGITQPEYQQPASGDAATGKRCSNRLLHASGYQLRYPDYRRGYQAVLDESVRSPE